MPFYNDAVNTMPTSSMPFYNDAVNTMPMNSMPLYAKKSHAFFSIYAFYT